MHLKVSFGLTIAGWSRAFFNIVTGRPFGLPVARFGLPVSAKPASLGDQDLNQVIVKFHNFNIGPKLWQYLTLLTNYAD